MPQFDFYSAFIQTFWFILGSITLYFVYTKFFLANHASVLKMRERLSKLFVSTAKTYAGFYDAVIKYLKKK